MSKAPVPNRVLQGDTSMELIDDGGSSGALVQGELGCRFPCDSFVGLAGDCFKDAPYARLVGKLETKYCAELGERHAPARPSCRAHSSSLRASTSSSRSPWRTLSSLCNVR